MDAWEAEIQRFREAVRRADAEIVGACQIGVAKAVAEGVRTAMGTRKYQDRTRRLTSSIDMHVQNTARGAYGYVEAAAKHASYVNDGTPPHPIFPKVAAAVEGPLPYGQTRRKSGKARSVLRFKVGGEWVFAKMVQHPGTKPDGFMDRAETRAEEVLRQEIDAGVARAAKILGNR